MHSVNIFSCNITLSLDGQDILINLFVCLVVCAEAKQSGKTEFSPPAEISEDQVLVLFESPVRPIVLPSQSDNFVKMLQKYQTV